MTPPFYPTSDSLAIRQSLIDAGVLRPGTDTEITRTPPTPGPVLRMDAVGRAVAERRVRKGGYDLDAFTRPFAAREAWREDRGREARRQR